jgi:hypothetical protein
MKKLYFLAVIAVTCLLNTGCEGVIEEVPNSTISQLKTFTRDANNTTVSYNGDDVSGFNSSVDGAVHVGYKSDGIVCALNGLSYKITFGNTKGGVRAEMVTAMRGDTEVFRVDYMAYDHEGRLTLARLNKSPEQGDAPNKYPAYISFTYYGDDSIRVMGDDTYMIRLSTEENKGNVCNVLDFAGDSYTSDYVINPYFYFLNIYGTPIKRLPKVEPIENTDKTYRVGKYSYSY